jgi:hypothetical protein
MGTINFSIPKPCHEEWARMSPQEKGRFCDKCAKTVVDFSSKSVPEIHQFIREHQHERVCGRFRNDQLSNPVRLEVSLSYFNNRLSASQGFFLAVLIAFGTSLFSCTTHNNETIGEVGLTDAATRVTDTLTGEHDITGMIFSEMHLEKIPDRTTKGEVEGLRIDSSPDTVDLPEVNIVEERMVEVYRTVGMIAVSRTEGEIIESLPDSISFENAIHDEPKESNNNTFTAYPNPAHDLLNVKFDISEPVRMGIELFDINGRFIRTLLDEQQMQSGENDLQLDITGLPPATYFVILKRGDYVEAKRIIIF